MREEGMTIHTQRIPPHPALCEEGDIWQRTQVTKWRRFRFRIQGLFGIKPKIDLDKFGPKMLVDGEWKAPITVTENEDGTQTMEVK